MDTPFPGEKSDFFPTSAATAPTTPANTTTANQGQTLARRTLSIIFSPPRKPIVFFSLSQTVNSTRGTASNATTPLDDLQNPLQDVNNRGQGGIPLKLAEHKIRCRRQSDLSVCRLAKLFAEGDSQPIYGVCGTPPRQQSGVLWRTDLITNRPERIGLGIPLQFQEILQ